MSARNGHRAPLDAAVLNGTALEPVALRLPAPASDAAAFSLAPLIESLLFVADGPVAVTDLARAMEVERSTVERALDDLRAALLGRGLRLQRAGQKVQLVTAPEAATAIQRFLGLAASARLSKAALETLAIVAYRQPVTRPEIEDLRGVNCDAVLRTLVGREMVAEVGRRDTVGLPIEYGTTFQFLEYFGLQGVTELPPVEEFAQAAAEAALRVRAEAESEEAAVAPPSGGQADES